MKMFSFLAFVSVIAAFGVEASPACVLDQSTIMKDMVSCMEHSPELAIMVATHMANPGKALESPDLLCRYKADITNLFVCLEHKLADCLPAKRDLLLSVLPTHDALMEGFNFMCNHKEMLNDDCYDSQMPAFMQCYMGNLRQMSTQTLALASDPRKMICKVIRTEEQCFVENKGSCSKAFVSMVVELLEKIFPLKQCNKSPALQVLMDSLLLQGQPLRYQPYDRKAGVVALP